MVLPQTDGSCKQMFYDKSHHKLISSFPAVTSFLLCHSSCTVFSARIVMKLPYAVSAVSFKMTVLQSMISFLTKLHLRDLIHENRKCSWNQLNVLIT